MLGVLEYLTDVPNVLSRARLSAREIVFSYHPLHGVHLHRAKCHENWVNQFRRWQLRRIVREAGWQIGEEVRSPQSRREFIYHARIPSPGYGDGRGAP